MTTRLLFVCSGNICRSPTAEAVLRSLIRERGLETEVEVDSAGTGNWHAGERADRRAAAAAARRGVHLDGVARQVTPDDFEQFDLLLAMDSGHLAELRRIAPPGTSGKVRMMSLVKTDPAPLEAGSLRRLAEAGARVPEILSDAPDRLVLQAIPRGRSDAVGEEDLSPESEDWSGFYLQHRCLPLARRVGLADVVSRVRVGAPVEPPARLHGDLWSGNVLADLDGRP